MDEHLRARQLRWLLILGILLVALFGGGALTAVPGLSRELVDALVVLVFGAFGCAVAAGVVLLCYTIRRGVNARRAAGDPAEQQQVGRHHA